MPEFSNHFHTPTPPRGYQNFNSPIGSVGNSNMTSPNERHEGFRTPSLPNKDYPKYKSVGGARSYKSPSPGDPTLENLNYFGTVSSNQSNGDVLKQIYKKVLDIDQKYKTMITMQENKKKRPTSTGGGSLGVVNSNSTPRESVYGESKFETEKSVNKSYSNKVSIRQDGLTTPEDEDGTSMDDVYTNNGDTIPKYVFRHSSINEHAMRSSAGKRSPGKTIHSKTKVKKIKYSLRSIDYSKEKNCGSNREFHG
jgi:hypothetical protein